MNINDFAYKNSLFTKKYIVKGFVTSKNEEYICYYLETANKESFKFVIKLKDSVIPFNLLSVESDIKFVPEKFYKPLGYLEAFFFVDRLSTERILRSNMFKIKEINGNLSFEFVEKDRFFELSKETFYEKLDEKIWVPDEAIVHDGRMHADDILSIALLKYVNPNLKYTRTREIPENFKGIVADVGEGRYDHHNLDKFRYNQTTNEQYFLPTGEPEVYASFGLLCKDILPGLIGIKNYYTVDHQIIRALDSADNYGTFSDLALFFSLFNPVWTEDVSIDAKFEEAVSHGLSFIESLIKRENARTKAQPYIQSKIAKMTDNILVLDKSVPWTNAAKKSDALFVVFPSDNGKIALQTVPTVESSAREHFNKKDLPSEWLTNPPEGLLFLHKSLFFSLFDTVEHAIAAAYLAKNS